MRSLARSLLLVSLIALPAAAQTDPCVAQTDPALHKRCEAIYFLWDQTTLPSTLPESVTSNQFGPFTNVPSGTTGEKLLFEMPRSYGTESNVAYHLVPPLSNRNNQLVIVHHGHMYAPADPANGTCHATDVYDPALARTLLSEGYSVLMMFMPHTTPEYCWNDPALGDHSAMFDKSTDKGEVLSVFLEPVTQALNHFQQTYTRFVMTGLSGGGWATTVYAALDPRIAFSYSVSGSMPLEVYPLGDDEQLLEDFYDIAGYKDLYFLAARETGRTHVQVLNRRDYCCFSEATFSPQSAWNATVRDYEKEVRLELAACATCGSFELEIDELHDATRDPHTAPMNVDSVSSHVYSWAAIHRLLSKLNGGDAAAGATSGDHAFVRGANGNLVHMMRSGWEDTGFAMIGTPAVVENAIGRIDVFYRDEANRLARASLDGSIGTWTEELLQLNSAAAVVTADPAAITTGSGKFDVVAPDKDAVLRHWARASNATTVETAGGTLANCTRPGLRYGPSALAATATGLEIVTRGRPPRTPLNATAEQCAEILYATYDKRIFHDRSSTGVAPWTTGTPGGAVKGFLALHFGNSVLRRWSSSETNVLQSESFSGSPASWQTLTVSSPPTIVGNPSATTGASEALVYATKNATTLFKCSFPYSGGSNTCSEVTGPSGQTITGSPVAAAGGAYVRTANGMLWFYNGTSWGQYTTPGGPANVKAKATTTTSVTVTWTGTSGTTYTVERKTSLTGSWSTVSGTPTFSNGTATLVDSTVAANTAYLYRVVAGGKASSVDLATTVAFTDADLTDRRALLDHLTELRTAVNLVRALVSLSAITLNTSDGVMRATHVETLRAGIADAYPLLQIPTPKTVRVVAGTSISEDDFLQIRDAVN